MWVQRWTVESESRRGKYYTVAMDERGLYGCDCPAWTRHMPRKDCKHVRIVKEGRCGVGELSGAPLRADAKGTMVGAEMIEIATRAQLSEAITRAEAAERVAKKRAERMVILTLLDTLRGKSEMGDGMNDDLGAGQLIEAALGFTYLGRTYNKGDRGRIYQAGMQNGAMLYVCHFDQDVSRPLGERHVNLGRTHINPIDQTELSLESIRANAAWRVA